MIRKSAEKPQSVVAARREIGKFSNAVILLSALLSCSGDENSVSGAVERSQESTEKRTYMAGDWKSPRYDLSNTALQPIAAEIHSPTVLTHIYTGGSLSDFVEADIDNDEKAELVTIQGGDLVVLDSAGNEVWRRFGLELYEIIDVFETSFYGTYVFCISSNGIYLFDGEGQTVFSESFDGALKSGAVKAQLQHASSSLIIGVWPDKRPTGFLFDYNFIEKKVNRVWESEFIEEAQNFPPELVLYDVDGDTVDDIIIATFGRMVAFDGLTGRSSFDSGWNGDFKWPQELARRNYGTFFVRSDLTSGLAEFFIFADAVSMHIAHIRSTERGFELVQDHLVGEAYAAEGSALKATINSIIFDHYAYSSYNVDGNARWDQYVGRISEGFEKPDVYIENAFFIDAVDLDCDENPEFLIGKTDGYNTSSFNEVQLIALNEGEKSILWRSGKGGEMLVDQFFKHPSESASAARNSGNPLLLVGSCVDQKTVFFRDRLGTVTALSYESGAVVEKAYFNGSDMFSASRFETYGFRFFSESESTLSISNSERDAPITQIPLQGLNATPIVGDLDADGFANVLIGKDGQIINYEIFQSQEHRLIWARPGQGFRISSSGKPNPVANRPNRVENIAIGDLVGDQKLEILSGSNIGDSSKLTMLDYKGAEIWSTNFPDLPDVGSEAGLFHWTPVAGSAEPWIFASGYKSGFNSEVGFALDASSGEILWTETNFTSESAGNIGFGPYAGFIGAPSNDGPLYMLGKTQFAEIRREGWSRLAEVTTYYGTPMFFQPSDLSKFVLAAGYDSISAYDVASVASGHIWRIATAPWEFYSRLPGVGDFDGDGTEEMAAVTKSGELNWINLETGEIEGRYQLGSLTRSAASNDVNADGKLDLILATNDGRVIAMGFSESGTEVIWSIALNLSLGDVVVADAMSYGSPQVLVAASDGNTYVIGDTRDRLQ